MKIQQQILACLLLLALSIKEGLSLETGLPLKCFECNSYDHPNCATLEGLKPVPCNSTQTLCRKVEQHINYNKQDHVRIFRQCATLGTAGTCDSRIGTYRFKSWYCHCDHDECNGSCSLLVTITLTVTLIAAAFEMKKHL
jgi:hypothetical protein